MRTSFGLIVAIFLTASAFPQTPSNRGKTFTAPDKSFAFVYHTPYQPYASGEMEKVQALSAIPVCDKDALACIVYPQDRFKGTNFGAAAFQVRTKTGVKSEQDCLALGSATPAAARTIGGVKFVHGIGSDASAGHSLQSDIYRAFQGGKCYELRIGITKTAFENYPAGTLKEFTAKDSERVHNDLEMIMNSWRLLAR